MPASERYTVLVVEDHMSSQALFADKLTLEGFIVLTANSVDEALQVCKQYADRIDLLITDVLLAQTTEFQLARTGKSPRSRANGVDLARQVRFKRPETRVLFISGHSDQDLKPLGVFREPWPLLRKPFHANNLLASVYQVLAD